MHTFAIANQKGGVGKTTTAINLAYFLARLGYRVLLMDLDPQGNASSGLAIDRSQLQQSMYNVLVEGKNLKEVIVKTGQELLDIAPASLDLAGAEIEMISLEGREFLLREAMQEIEPFYDAIFVDCPPSLGILTINAFTAVHGILVPVQCEYYALEGLGQLMQTVTLVRESLNPALEVEGAVLTMYDGRTNLAREVVEEVRSFFGHRIFDTIIPRNVRLAEAPGFGQSVFEYAPDSMGAQAYRAFAEEFASRLKK
ncbi:MAG TPA: AAA family ATPase [bacterium]|nr:AAA family ATPase [bacterium]